MGISDEGVRLTLRLPEKLRTQLGQQAIKNHRSLNSEIVALLSDFSINDNYLQEPKTFYKSSSKELVKACNNLSSKKKDAIVQLIELLAEK